MSEHTHNHEHNEQSHHEHEEHCSCHSHHENHHEHSHHEHHHDGHCHCEEGHSHNHIDSCCSCGCEHGSDHEESGKTKKIILAGVLFVLGMVLEHLNIKPVFYGNIDIIKTAVLALYLLPDLLRRIYHRFRIVGDVGVDFQRDPSVHPAALFGGGTEDVAGGAHVFDHEAVEDG